MQSKIILMMSVGFLFALISWMSLGLMLAMALLACVEHRGRGAVREGRATSCPGMVAVGRFSLNFEAISR